VSALFTRLDPRTRIVTICCATAIISSTPRGVLLPFAAYAPLCLLLLLTHRVSVKHLLMRCAAASPFILLAAGLLTLEGGTTRAALQASFPSALSVAGKGYAAVLLLAFLTYSTALSELLTGLRRLGSPESLNLILGMMYRYTGLLSEEYARMERARDCRTVAPLGHQRFEIAGRQLGALILRSWDRAERVHAAMLARGFDGAWPQAERSSLGRLDVTFAVLCVAAFLSSRILL
jgi:cobalt/nickel transport system permease protein